MTVRGGPRGEGGTAGRGEGGGEKGRGEEGGRRGRGGKRRGEGGRRGAGGERGERGGGGRGGGGGGGRHALGRGSPLQGRRMTPRGGARRARAGGGEGGEGRGGGGGRRRVGEGPAGGRAERPDPRGEPCGRRRHAAWPARDAIGSRPRGEAGLGLDHGSPRTARRQARGADGRQRLLRHSRRAGAARRGARLRIAERHPERAFRLRPLANLGQIQFARCDVTDRRSVEAAMHGRRCGGLSGRHFRRRSARDQAEGAGIAAEAAAAQGAGASSMSRRSAPMPASDSGYAATKGEGEARVRAAFPQATVCAPRSCSARTTTS